MKLKLVCVCKEVSDACFVSIANRKSLKRFRYAQISNKFRARRVTSHSEHVLYDNVLMTAGKRMTDTKILRKVIWEFDYFNNYPWERIILKKKHEIEMF